MAKSKPTEFSPAPAFDEDDEPTPAVDPRDAEIERLKAKLAEKEAESDELAAAVDAAEAKAAELAVQQGKAIEPTKAVAGPLRKFLVSVQHGPKWVVEAISEGDAGNVFLTATGMISWVSRPEIREVGPDVPLGRFEG